MVNLQVEHFCKCMSLRAGCIFIGALSIILALITVIITIVGIVGIEAACAQRDCTKSDVSTAVTIARVILGITLALTLLYLIFSAMLVHGARKDRAGLMNPWFYWTIVGIVFSIIGMFTTGLNPVMFVRIAWIILSIYFLIVVRSYQNVLRGEPAAVPKA
ncbi:uncharacterized protein LOC143040241 [Oratosquilla oratoria]|uniref:uncharacterized protein LOC143040241 n=1 Tax=Oratosquilla oratoria TaxID=337810 RepID=UPI003F7694C3